MKRLLPIAAIVLSCAVTVVPHASAQSAHFVYTGVPAGPIFPGATFTVSVSLQVVTGGAVNNFAGLSYWWAQQTAGAPAFQLNSRVTGTFGQPGASLFTDLQLPGLVTPQTMDPINRNPNGTQTSTDLGALIGGGLMGQPTGTYFIANLTFQVLPDAALGPYILGNTTSATPGVGGRISVWNDDEGDTAPIAASPFFIVQIVPEPGSVALLCVGLVSAGALIYRRRVTKPTETNR